jgi:hypothetical protein
MRRRTALLGLATVALGLTSVPAPVGALTHEGFTVSREQPASTRDYPLIVGENAAGADAPEFGPAGCSDGGALSGACDAIPIDIVRPPEYDDYSPWGVEVTLKWESEQLTDDSVQETQSNDLDMYFYYASGEQLSTDGATGTNPEQALFVSPPTGKYFIIINNFTGANTGYTIDVKFIPEEQVEQVTEDDFARPRQPKPVAPATARPSGSTTSTTAATSSTVGGRPTLPTVEVGDDGDFSGVAIGGNRSGEPNIFEGGNPLDIARDEDAPPASGAALVGWLIALPAALLAAAWWLLRRRRPANILPS